VVRPEDAEQLRTLPTPVIADAVVRLGLPPRQAPPGLRGTHTGAIAGRALPVRHAGSVDVFLEVFEHAVAGDVLVIDNGARTDEACIGDLVAHEAKGAGITGIAIWGLHRDATEIIEIGLPVFSYGTLPFGPISARESDPERFTSARFGADVVVTRADIVVADDNGAVFFAADSLDSVLRSASAIRAAEAAQVDQLRQGVSLRQQFGFVDYLQARQEDPARTFRQHLRERDKAVEE